MSAQHTPGPVHIYKCTCGDPICSQYTLSTQGGVGFSLGDARLYSAAPDYDRAARLALRLLEADRSIFFNCHTVAGDLASLSANEACVIAAYDEAINGLKTAIAKAEGR